MKKRHGFGSLLFDLMQMLRSAGFFILLMTLAVGIVYLLLRTAAHLLQIH